MYTSLQLIGPFGKIDRRKDAVFRRIFWRLTRKVAGAKSFHLQKILRYTLNTFNNTISEDLWRDLLQNVHFLESPSRVSWKKFTFWIT